MHVGTLPAGSPFGINTYEDHVFQFRDAGWAIESGAINIHKPFAGSQEVLSTLRMFRTRVVIALDLDFMSSITNCDAGVKSRRRLG